MKTHWHINRLNAIKTSVISFVLGDVLGLSIQFIPNKILKKQLQNFSIEEIILNGTNSNIPFGTWSDDSSLTLCTMASIAEQNKINLEDISKKFCNWFQYGYMTPNNKAFDIGRTTYNSIVNSINNNSLLQGFDDIKNNGNGSLMRILPVAIYAYDKTKSTNDFFETIKKVSSLTHAHPISILGCYIYSNVVCMILDSLDKKLILENLKTLHKNIPNEYKKFLFEYKEVLNGRFVQKFSFELIPNGYVKNSLETVLWSFFDSQSIEDCIYKAISLGGDTDTNGALAGGLSGLYYGIKENKPYFSKTATDFINKIIKIDLIEEIIKNFIITLYYQQQ